MRTSSFYHGHFHGADSGRKKETAAQKTQTALRKECKIAHGREHRLDYFMEHIWTDGQVRLPYHTVGLGDAGKSPKGQQD